MKKKTDEIKINDIMYLHIWHLQFAIGGEHYYGELISDDREIREEIQRPLSYNEAKYLNTKDNCKFNLYNKGDLTDRFKTEEQLISYGKEQFKKNFPNKKVLILGDTGYVEPKTVLIGPRYFKTYINKLVKEMNNLNWEDNEEELNNICKEWVKVWPIKYKF